MQNNNKNPFDGPFTDQAWQQMHDLLDQEMPREKKRRRFPVFWIFILGVAIGGGLFWLLEQQFEQVPIQEQQDQVKYIPTSPIASISTNEAIPSKDANKASHTLQQASEKPIALSEQPTTSTNSNQVTKATFSEQQHTTGGFASKHLQASVQVASEKGLIARKQFVENEFANSIVKTENIEQQAAKVRFEIALLEHKGLRELEASENEKCTKQAKLTANDMKKRPPFGIRVGMGYNFTNQLNTHIGAFWQTQIQPKWTLETGLSYYRFSPTIHLSSSDEIALFDSASNTSDESTIFGEDTTQGPDTNGASTGMSGTEVDSTIDQGDLILPSTRISRFVANNTRHKLVLPIQLGYQLAPKWELFGGLQVAYTFPKAGLNASDLDLSALMYSDLLIQRKFEVWTKASVRFSPNPRLGMELGYNYALSPALYVDNSRSLSTSNVAYKNNFVEFSLLYKLKK